MSIFDSYEKACQRTAENELAKCRYNQRNTEKKHARLRKLVRVIIDDGFERYWLKDEEYEEIKKLSNWKAK